MEEKINAFGQVFCTQGSFSSVDIPVHSLQLCIDIIIMTSSEHSFSGNFKNTL